MDRGCSQWPPAHPKPNDGNGGDAAHDDENTVGIGSLGDATQKRETDAAGDWVAQAVKRLVIRHFSLLYRLTVAGWGGLLGNT